MIEKIKELVARFEPDIVGHRRIIHHNPELAFKEEATCAYVKKILEGLNIEIKQIGTGVVGYLKGKNSGKTIALRADMDALPMQEKTGLDYASKNDGVMHACGHDMHTAMLLGSALVLNNLKDEFKGDIRFVFQPAEESNPDCGAIKMLEGGALQGCEGIVGMHVWPSLVTGTISTKTGAVMSASDRIFIKIKGKTSHGSAPHEGIDACAAAAYVITALQSIVSRQVSPLDSCVISIGVIHGGLRYNVIPDLISMEGTVRSAIPAVRDKVAGLIERTIKGVCEALGAGYEFEYQRGYDPTVNEPVQTKKVIASIEKYIGSDNLIIAEKQNMGGEDFSFYSKVTATTYLWLGCRPGGIPANDFPPLHNVGFNPDEGCIKTGVGAMVCAAVDLLNT